MCSDDQHEEKMILLRKIEENTCLIAPRPPIYQTVLVSATQPFVMDYHERLYAFVWLPGTSYTFSCEDFGTIVVPASTWYSPSLSPGIRMFIPAQATTVPIIWKFTDTTLI